MAKIAVIGSANADLAVRVARRPLGGETVAGSAVVTSPGGKGANQAAAAALLGGEVSFVGRVGRDGHGALLRDALRSSGVDVAALGDSEAPTSVALIVLTPDGENSIIVAGGANQQVTPDYLRQAASAWADAALVVAQLEVPLEAVEFAAAECRARGVRFLLNAAPAAHLPDAVVAACDPLVVNETEAAFLLGRDDTDDPEALAAGLLALGASSVVVTLGSRGALAASASGGLWRVPAERVPVVDTTGAGDAFVGGLATVLAAGGDLAEGLRRGTAAGACAVQGAGAQASYAGLREVR
ncbi:MAG TPA: ribokinase [Ornithinibacter sp.]|nr:ribokinase [Ornithinibacter sp.]HQA14018.1 ribokinase [Ornithinibacter sp.]HQD68158.1 ribokinase [Ornithinibacter sp.]